MSCDCCGRKEPDINTLCLTCSSFGPMSFTLCNECAEAPTEPKWVFEYLYRDIAAGNIESVRPEYREYRTYKDGKYIVLSDWWELRQI